MESSCLFLFYILGFFLNILYKETIKVTNPKSIGNHGIPNKEYFNSSKEDWRFLTWKMTSKASMVIENNSFTNITSFIIIFLLVIYSLLRIISIEQNFWCSSICIIIVNIEFKCFVEFYDNWFFNFSTSTS